jgi:hypothetical protein
MADRTIIPIFDPGDWENAIGRCEECNEELKRLPIAFASCKDHPTANAIVHSPGSSLTTGIAEINLHPLNFLDAEPEAITNNGYPTVEEILVFCCGATHSAKPEKVVARYQQLHQGLRIQAIPSFDYINKKVIVPLLQAQSCYMTANFIATTALCGIVAEMLSNLAWEIYQPFLKLNKKEITLEMQKPLFGMPVESMTQEARLNLLKAVDIITQGTWDKFKRVKDVRNEYVHFHKYNPTEEAQKKQAAEMFTLVQELVCEVIGQDFSDGRLNLNQATFAYLQLHGLIKPFPAASQNSSSDSSVVDGSNVE